ncbi:MAG TPA: universal stress protein [Candidatus Methylomirabilis sp.]|nr:universal stress protein [Candidatus Methylomirabilis sp.]
MRVLIALDATPGCGEIVRAVASRPWPADTKFLLLHVLDPFPFAKAPITLKRAVEGAEAQLKSVCKDLCSRGWEVERQVALGRPRRAIAKAAEEWNSDFVVVGSNDPSALTRLLLGSTARAVLRHAPCSVEIVRSAEKETRAEKGMQILVATDGSKCSTAALRSVAGRPWPQGSRAKVVSLPEPFLPMGGFPYLDLTEVEHQNDAALADAKRYAAEGAEILTKGGLKATAETPTPQDSDAREIVKEAEKWKADLIVLGSHGRRGFDRMTMGSVSEHVALHAPCSVEVIRGPQDAAKRAQKAPKKGARP